MSSLSLRHALALAFPPSLTPEVSHLSGQVNSQMGEMRHVPLYPMSAGIEAGRIKCCLQISRILSFSSLDFSQVVQQLSQHLSLCLAAENPTWEQEENHRKR